MLSNCGAGEDAWESLEQQGDQTSQSKRKSTLNVHWKDWFWSWSSNPLATWCEELTYWERPWFWERFRARNEGATEDEMVGWHHWLKGHEFGQTPGDSEGQGSILCYCPWGRKESDMTGRLNNNIRTICGFLCYLIRKLRLFEVLPLSSDEKHMSRSHSSQLLWYCLL